MKPKLLIVDDEPQFRDALVEAMSEHFVIESATNGREALEMALQWRPDLILMDFKMPEMDGVTACRMIREQEITRHIPILMLTAMDTAPERISAFNMGVDDYIAKPFSTEELRIRLFSKLRRVHELQNVASEKIEINNMLLDDRIKQVTIGGAVVDLSPTEYRIVKLLMNNVEQVVSREKIMQVVWNDGQENTRLMDAHITALRKKLSRFGGIFQTVYGAGYRLRKGAPSE